MGLNNRIGGAIDVHAPRTMEETLKKVVRQELKIKKDDSIKDNKRKNTWNSERGDRGSQKKPFKEFKKTKFSMVKTGKAEPPLMKIKIARIMRRKDHQGDVSTMAENIT